MKTSIHIIEQIIRAKTALHLTLVALRKDGKADIGGARIDDLIAEVDAGLARSEWMLVLFKNEIAAANYGSRSRCISRRPGLGHIASVSSECTEIARCKRGAAVLSAARPSPATDCSAGRRAMEIPGELPMTAQIITLSRRAPPLALEATVKRYAIAAASTGRWSGVHRLPKTEKLAFELLSFVFWPGVQGFPLL